jgi:phage tail sheath protein FI
LPELDYPGVYIEEIPGTSHPIEGVPTSTAAFVGYTLRGPLNEPRRATSFDEFESEFGGPGPPSDVFCAISHFFANGGSDAWVVRVAGETGDVPPSPAELAGSEDAKTGIRALDDVDLLNLVIVPGQSDATLQKAIIAYAEQRRAFAILDLPGDVKTPAQAEAWFTANQQLRHANAAVYFPRILIADPDPAAPPCSVANSGAIAGIYARTDQQRGVWKAPAGLEAQINGVAGLEYNVTARQQDQLNTLGLNVLRSFPGHANVVSGSRTLRGADVLASEWKYVPVRRIALFIEESLYRGLQWATLEPNAEPLWARIRSSVATFMHGLFRQGAFQGSTPHECYVVRCDAETTSQADIDAGVLNVVVGFAPLKPAEFSWLRIRFQALT